MKNATSETMQTGSLSLRSHQQQSAVEDEKNEIEDNAIMSKM